MMKSVQFEDSSVIPSKVVCVGRNYLGHIQELGNAVPDRPVIFIKPNSAVTDALALPLDEAVGYEGEICFLIRNNTFCGVGFGLDLTKRAVQSDLKSKGLPWERSKAFDGSAVLSEFVPFDGEITGLSLRLTINGNVVQQGGVEEMINSPEVLLAETLSFLSLEDNDVLMTGTPEGVGPVNRGDMFIGQIFLGEILLLESQWLVS
jgi:2-keto-4-pentenoate hydratase/2-oxohepta-3-ene-1,7-dioic acid hydratase in catechol pathway